jgi:hypothetical protein
VKVLAVALAALALAPAADALTIGAYYYAWYEPAQWEKGYIRSQEPWLGEYDSRDPATIRQHYEWAQRYGVDVFIASWWGTGGAKDVTLRDHVLPSPARGRTRLALLYESTKLGLTDNRVVFGDAEIATLLADFDYLAATYLGHPAYYRIGGRPVVFLYVSRIYRGRYAEALTTLRTHVLERHGLDLYLVGDEVDWDIGPARGRIRLYDAITGYTLYSRMQPPTGFLRLAEQRMRAFRRMAAQEEVAFVPGALPGYDDTGIRPEEDHYVLAEPGLFGRMLRLAGRYVDARLDLMTVTSWNEWHEDTQIEPTAESGYGFQLLEQLARFKRQFVEDRKR